MEEGADAVGVAGVVVMAELLSPKANLKLPIHRVHNPRVLSHKAAIPKVGLADIPAHRTAVSRIDVPAAEAVASSSVASDRIADPRILVPLMPESTRLPWITATGRTCRTTMETAVVKTVAIRNRAPRP